MLTETRLNLQAFLQQAGENPPRSSHVIVMLKMPPGGA